MLIQHKENSGMFSKAGR